MYVKVHLEGRDGGGYLGPADLSAEVTILAFFSLFFIYIYFFFQKNSLCVERGETLRGRSNNSRIPSLCPDPKLLSI